MNDFSELEAELRRLRPCAPSADLAARIETALAEPPPASTPTAAVLPRVSRFQLNWLSLGLGLAAAAGLLLLARVETKPTARQPQTVAATTPLPAIHTAPAVDTMRPTALTQVVYNVRDEGLVFPAGSATPVRRVRQQSRETVQWRNPSTGASLRVSYPSEEVVLTPVSGQ